MCNPFPDYVIYNNKVYRTYVRSMLAHWDEGGSGNALVFGITKYGYLGLKWILTRTGKVGEQYAIFRGHTLQAVPSEIEGVPFSEISPGNSAMPFKAALQFSIPPSEFKDVTLHLYGASGGLYRLEISRFSRNPRFWKVPKEDHPIPILDPRLAKKREAGREPLYLRLQASEKGREILYQKQAQSLSTRIKYQCSGDDDGDVAFTPWDPADFKVVGPEAFWTNLTQYAIANSLTESQAYWTLVDLPFRRDQVGCHPHPWMEKV